MKYLMIALSLLMSLSAFALTEDDLKIIQNAQGEYTLEGKLLTKDQQRICLDGDLEFNKDQGSLTLGGTPLAIDLFSHKENLIEPTEESKGDCSEAIEVKMEKNILYFENNISCTGNGDKFKTVRTIEIQPDGIRYKQNNNLRNQVVKVECVLKKVPSEKKTKWKVIPDTEAIESK